MHRLAGVLLCVCAFGQEQPKPAMTARELFYSTAGAPAAKPSAARPPAVKPVPVKPPVARKPPAASQVVSAGQSQPEAAPSVPEPVPMQDGVKLVTVSSGRPTSAPPPETGSALGLKYTLLKLSGGEMQETPVDSVFHSGDRIQFLVETNGPGYLYIISKGSSGVWKPMFPSPELDGGSNLVEGFKPHVMPPQMRFVFDEQAGTEKLFLVFTRTREADIENMIYALQGGKQTPAPAPRPEVPAPLVRASIDDAEVGRLRAVYARDLIVEAVGPNTPGGQKKESAVYVVNPSGREDSRLVADLLLVHK